MSQKPQKPPLDYSQWPTKQQVAAILDCSTKSVEKFAEEGKLQSARWKRPSGGPRIAVYNPGDVERLRLDRSPGAAPAFVMPPSSEVSQQAEKSKAVSKTAGMGMVQLLQALLEAAEAAGVGSQKLLGTSQKSRKLYVPLHHKIFMTVRESSAYVGKPERWVRHQIATGKLAADMEGYTRVRRSDLEKL